MVKARRTGRRSVRAAQGRHDSSLFGGAAFSDEGGERSEAWSCTWFLLRSSSFASSEPAIVDETLGDPRAAGWFALRTLMMSGEFDANSPRS